MANKLLLPVNSKCQNCTGYKTEMVEHFVGDKVTWTETKFSGRSASMASKSAIIREILDKMIIVGIKQKRGIGINRLSSAKGVNSLTLQMSDPCSCEKPYFRKDKFP